MKKWNVYGTVPISVCFCVDAEDAQSAIDIAYERFSGLEGYAGNGHRGANQMRLRRATECEVEFNDAQPADD
jgi:hypothetical protein